MFPGLIPNGFNRLASCFAVIGFLQSVLSAAPAPLAEVVTKESGTRFIAASSAFSPSTTRTGTSGLSLSLLTDGHGRHHAFFKAIWKFHVRGCVPLHELTDYMGRCDYDGHQKKRYGQIIKNLRSGGYGSPKELRGAAKTA